MLKKIVTPVIILAVSGLAIWISTVFVDRQLVWWLAAHHSQHFALLGYLANDIVFVIAVLTFIFYLYYFVKLVISQPNSLDYKCLIVSNSVVISYFMKDILKNIFGRYWPATWVCNNPSLINNHAYGFNWFKSGTAYASFPSGHATLMCAFCVSSWFLFPKFRWPAIILCTLVIIGEAGMYYHFISDLIAGATLGSLIGYCSYLAGATNTKLSVNRIRSVNYTRPV